MAYSWDFSIVWELRHAFIQGLLVSIELTAIASIAGTMLAIPWALGLLSTRRTVRVPLYMVMEALRALPLLVLLLWAYFVIPSTTGLFWSAFWTAAVVMTLNFAAFGADILRGGIIAIPREHIEAAESLGMTRGMVMRRVIIPETFRRVFVAMTAMYITMFKLSTLASVITVRELLHVAETAIVGRFRPLEIYTAVAVLYLAVIIPFTAAARRLERSRWFSLYPE